MNKTLLSLLLIVLLFAACSKSGSNPSKNSDQGASIVGSWLVNTEHVKVYSIKTNTLVFDTTTTQFGTVNQFRWYYIFNKDGSAYETTLPIGHGPGIGEDVHPDTTDWMTYTVTGKTINVVEGEKYSFTILQSSATKLALEEVFVTPAGSEYPELDVYTTYKFVQDTYYDKQ